MSVNEVYMDVPAVQNIAKTLDTVGNVLQAVNKAMELLSNTLKTTAFIGLVGGLAVAHVIDIVRPHIEEMAKKCEELSKDVNASVDAYQRGDAQGATRFY